MEFIGYPTWILIISAFSMIVVAACGYYQSTFVMPEYFADPPASLRRYQADKSVRFWLPLHGVVLISLILSLIANLPTERAPWLIGATVAYVVCWITTFAFFIPGVILFNAVDVDGPPSPELLLKGRTWLRRSSIRLVFMFLAAVGLIVGLAIPITS